MDNLFDTNTTSTLFDTAAENEDILINEDQPTPFSASVVALASSTPTADFDKDMKSIQEHADAILNGYSQAYESQSRIQIAAEDKITRIKALTGLGMEPGVTPELQASIAAATDAVYAESDAINAKVAAEKRAVQRITDLAATDETQARLLYNQYTHPSAISEIVDFQGKALVRAKSIDKAMVAKEDQSWMADVTDFVVGEVLAQNYFGDLGNVPPEVADKVVTHWYDVFFSGSRAQSENEALNRIPLAQYQEAWDKVLPMVMNNSRTLGYMSDSANLELLRQLNHMDDAEARDRNFYAAFNIASLVTVLNPKSLLSLSSHMMSGGARKQAAATMAAAARDMVTNGAGAVAQKTGITAVDVADTISLTAINPVKVSGRNKLLSGTSLSTPPTVNVPLTAEVDALTRGERLVNEAFPDLLQTPRLTGNETVEAKDALTSSMTNEIGYEPHDVNFGKEVLPGSVELNYGEFTFGTASGTPFLTEEAAMAAAGKTGYGGAQVVKDVAGGWFFKVKKNMPEFGFYTSELKPLETHGLIGTIFRKLISNPGISDKGLTGAAAVSGATRAQIIDVLTRQMKTAFKPLNAESREALNQAMKLGQTHEKWWTDSELDDLFQRSLGRGITDAEKAAYHTGRDVMDMSYALRNSEIYTGKAIRGFESIELSSPLTGALDIDAKISTSFSAPKSRVYNLTDDVHYTREGTFIDDNELRRLNENGYVLIKAETGIQLSDGTTVDTFVAKAKDIRRRPLDKVQLGYAEGGTRVYTDSYFIKRGSTGVQQDTGKLFKKTPNTFATAEFRGVAHEAAALLERARILFKESKGTMTAVDLDEQVFKGQSFMDGKKFITEMEEHGMDHPFEAVYDREMPSMYNEVNNEIDNFVDLEAPPGWSPSKVNRGRTFYSGKGQALPDVSGALAPTLDPYKALERNLYNIANLTSFSNYKTEAVERWLSSFKNNLDLSGLNSSYDQFINGRITTNDVRMRNKIEAQREVIKRILNFDTPSAKNGRAITRELEDFVSDYSHTGARVTNWVLEKNPVTALRTMAFDLTLGLFNIAQFPIQISTAFVATAISPTHGMRGWATMYPMMAFMMRGGDQATLDVLAKRGLWKTAGFESEAAFKDYANVLYKSGWLKTAGNHLAINGGTGVNAGFSTIGNRANQIRDMGRIFFNSAEVVNRTVAYRIGWGRALDQGILRSDPKFLSVVAKEANDMAFRMTTESAAYWQKGLLSIPTQFWAYSARNLEMLMGSTLTKNERLRYLAANVFLGGSAAVPGLTLLQRSFDNNEGHVAAVGTPISLVTRGFVDNLIYAITGADVKAGSKLATQDLWADTIRGMLGFESYGQSKSFVDVMGGATLSIMLKTFEAGLHVPVYLADYMFATNGYDMGEELLTEETMIDLLSSIKTVDNGLKARMAYNYNAYYSKKGAKIIDGIPSSSAFFYALGFAPGQQDEMNANSAYLKNKQQAVKDAAQVLTGYKQELAQLDFQSPSFEQEYLKIRRKTNAFTRLLPPDVAKEAIKRSSRSTPDSLAQSFADKMKKQEKLEGTAPNE